MTHFYGQRSFNLTVLPKSQAVVKVSHLIVLQSNLLTNEQYNRNSHNAYPQVETEFSLRVSCTQSCIAYRNLTGYVLSVPALDGGVYLTFRRMIGLKICGVLINGVRLTPKR